MNRVGFATTVLLLLMLSPTVYGLKFAVIADPHLCVYEKEPNVKNTVKMFHYNEKIFKNIIRDISKQDLDFVLIAGDLTKDSEPWNHREMLNILRTLRIPWFVVPGNHDVWKGYMEGVHWTLNEFVRHYHPWLFKGKSYYAVKVSPNVLLIGLNTNDPEKILTDTWGGHISKEQLEWLNRTLANSGEKLVIILMHHALLDHPSPWDKEGMNSNFKVSNADEVLEVLKNYTQKHNIVVFCGHIHTTDIAEKDRIIEIACPSTCTYPLAYRIVEVSDDADVMKIKTIWYPDENLRKIALEEALKAGWTKKDIEEAEGKPWDRNKTIVFGNKIRNVILLIGDGMGFAQLHLTELTYGNLTMENYSWDSTGFELTDSLSGEVTDSAAAGTAIATGFKTYNGMISTLKTAKGIINLTTILEVARKLGKSTGLVTTTRITHATPAVFASHVDDREKEKEIARQLIEHKVNVLLGGGIKEFDESTLRLARDLGYQIVYSRTELENVDGEYVLGLFARSHIPYVLDRDEKTPTLVEMTDKALEILDRNPNGFFLMVEGGRIDHACHINDPASTVAETKEFDDVVDEVLDFARTGDTVVVVTADHETGGLTLGINYGRSIDFEQIKRINGSVYRMAKEIEKGKDAAEIVKKYTGIDLTPKDVERLKSSEDLTKTLGEVLSEKLGLTFATHKHSGEPVPLMTYGFDFAGFHHHVETSKKLTEFVMFGHEIVIKGKLVKSNVKGDADGDGKISKIDAYLALTCVGNLSKVYPNLDMDGNGVIDYNDVCEIYAKA